MIMLECVDGGELFERITKKSHLTEKLAKDYVIDMLSAVKYCHDRKIVHRDLKPENFLMSSQSEYAAVKLIDFGFAVQLEEGGSVSDDCGTPEYMAPEAMMQQPYGTSVDMWALGVITYILLCGYPPFPNGDLQRLIRYVTTGRYVFHSKYWTPVSAEAKDLISKLLVVDPAKRLDVDGAFAHPWLSMEQRLLEGNDLSGSLKRLKRSWAARKWRASIRAVIAVNKMTRLGQRLAEEKVSGSTHEKRKQAQAALADEERKEKERGEGEEAAGDGDDTASEIMYGSDVDELEDQSTRDSGTWSQLTPRFPELVKEEDD
jgi:serine/threonine protein kinase